MHDWAGPPPLHCVKTPVVAAHDEGSPQQTPAVPPPLQLATLGTRKLQSRLPSHLPPTHLVATAGAHSPVTDFTFSLYLVAATVSL